MNTSPMAFGAINPFNFNTPVATPQSVRLSQTVAMSNFTGSRLDSFVENSPRTTDSYTPPFRADVGQPGVGQSYRSWNTSTANRYFNQLLTAVNDMTPAPNERHAMKTSVTRQDIADEIRRMERPLQIIDNQYLDFLYSLYDEDNFNEIHGPETPRVPAGYVAKISLDQLQAQYDDDGNFGSFSAYYTSAPQLPPLPDAYDVGSNLAFANQTLSINSIVADAYYDRLFDNTRDSLSAGGWGEDGVSQKNIQSELDRMNLVGDWTADDHQYVAYLETLKDNYGELADDHAAFPPGTIGLTTPPIITKADQQAQYDDDGDSSNFTARYRDDVVVTQPPPPSPSKRYDVGNGLVVPMDSVAKDFETTTTQANRYFDRLRIASSPYSNHGAGASHVVSSVTLADIQNELDRLADSPTPVIEEGDYVGFLKTLKSNFLEIADDSGVGSNTARMTKAELQAQFSDDGNRRNFTGRYTEGRS
ncbi:MAG: hypothetical protein KC476_07980 [Cyanobacteria bacterium HKST-UBA06]|nr:hypothetical protein [Cyanobacteria bacterium HKST-UBA06]